MPRYGPGTKVVLRGLNNMLPDEVKQRSEKDQGPGTRLVMKGLKHALPSIAERNEQHSMKREHVPGKSNGRGPCLFPFLPPKRYLVGTQNADSTHYQENPSRSHPTRKIVKAINEQKKQPPHSYPTGKIPALVHHVVMIDIDKRSALAAKKSRKNWLQERVPQIAVLGSLLWERRAQSVRKLVRRDRRLVRGGSGMFEWIGSSTDSGVQGLSWRLMVEGGFGRGSGEPRV